MKSKYKQILADSFRIAVVVFSLMALVVSGASAASRAFQPEVDKDATESVISDVARLVPGEPADDDIGDAMTPGSRPNTEQAATLSALSFYRLANEDDRYAKTLTDDSVNIESVPETEKSTPSVVSLCMVSSSLGRQFTLLGAKPSGTM